MNINELKQKVIDGYQITKVEAMELYQADYQELLAASKEIREACCGNAFDICTIINAKSGRCSEDCKFCAQSGHYHTNAEVYPLLDHEIIIEDAVKQYNNGILRYSLVSSGRKLSAEDIERVCHIVEEIKKRCDIHICISGGLLTEEEFQQLHEAGVERVHNNLESSRNYFPQICSTHQFDQKVRAIQAAQKAGMEVCSGGIIGLGESREDRIDMVMELRELDVHSIPINILNPIPNTPLEHNEVLTEEEINRTIAVYRFIMPHAALRLAGGRALMEQMGKTAFEAGANAAISGDMLTTYGISVEDDFRMIENLNYEIKLIS